MSGWGYAFILGLGNKVKGIRVVVRVVVIVSKPGSIGTLVKDLPWGGSRVAIGTWYEGQL